MFIRNLTKINQVEEIILLLWISRKNKLSTNSPLKIKSEHIPPSWILRLCGELIYRYFELKKWNFAQGCKNTILFSLKIHFSESSRIRFFENSRGCLLLNLSSYDWWLIFITSQKSCIYLLEPKSQKANRIWLLFEVEPIWNTRISIYVELVQLWKSLVRIAISHMSSIAKGGVHNLRHILREVSPICDK